MIPKPAENPRRRRRRTRPEIAQARAAEMYAMAIAGWPVPMIAALFKISRGHAYQAIRSVPPAVRRAVEGSSEPARWAAHLLPLQDRRAARP